MVDWEEENYCIEELNAQLRHIDREILWNMDQDALELNTVDELIQRAFIISDSLLGQPSDCNELRSTEDEAKAYAVKLVQDDTPMRELTEQEIIKHKGLVDASRKLEYMSFLENETFKIIRKKDIPPHPSGKPRRVISSRELIQWKTYLLKVKIRVVLRGFQDDRRKGGLTGYSSVDSPTLRIDSLRCIYQLAADYDYDIWTWDLKTAFLQGFTYDDEESCVYWDPPPMFRKMFGMKEDECCIAIKSIYGLDDAPRRWYEKLASKMCERILDVFKWKQGGFGALRHWLDPCLFMKHEWKVGKKTANAVPIRTDLDDGRPTGPPDLPGFHDIGIAGTRRKPCLNGDTCTLAAGTHVDDIIATGTHEELTLLNAFLEAEFKVGAHSKASAPEGFLYRGQRVRKLGKNHIQVDMREYEEREVLPIQFANLPKRVMQRTKETVLSDVLQAHYRAVVGKLIWISCQVRADISCMVSQASSRLGKATEADAVFTNKIIQHVAENRVSLNYYKLGDIAIPRMARGTCDAAFKRKDERDDRARGGYLLTVGTDTDDLVGLISYGTAKIHRVCKSPTGAEAITITGLGDQMDTFYNIMFWFYPLADPTGEILTDAFSVTSSQFKYCSEVTPNLTVDFALIRQRTRDGLVNMKHQLGEYMAADGLTKATTVAQKVLLDFMSTGRLGTKGVNISKIEDGVRKRLEKAFACKTIHPNNLSFALLDKMANTVNAEITGGKSNGMFYENGQVTF
jgi:hypothetical protein